MQAIRIDMPEDIYRRLSDMALTSHRPLEEVIFQTIRGNLPPTLDDVAPEYRDLVADLQELGDDALWAVAKEPFAARPWRRHQRLLHKGEEGTLTPNELTELTALHDATDRIVMRRSFALALLRWRGYTVPAAF